MSIEWLNNEQSTYGESLSPFSVHILSLSAPSPPEDLLAEVVSPNTVKLKWGPPREQNGIITYYIIYYSVKNVPDTAWSSIHQNGRFQPYVFLQNFRKLEYIH